MVATRRELLNAAVDRWLATHPEVLDGPLCPVETVDTVAAFLRDIGGREDRLVLHYDCIPAPTFVSGAIRPMFYWGGLAHGIPAGWDFAHPVDFEEWDGYANVLVFDGLSSTGIRTKPRRCEVRLRGRTQYEVDATAAWYA